MKQIVHLIKIKHLKENYMKKYFLVFAAVGLFYFCGCSKDANITSPVYENYQSSLQQLADLNWNDFANGKTGLQGGYAMQILSPKGDYFIGAGDLKTSTNKIHFRAASTTKSFTAAAILLLHQQGKLNIDHPITDTIPGKTIPYVPDGQEYNIPNKNKITIKLLLQHRAGVFDVSNDPGPFPDTYINFIKSQDPNHTFTIDELVNQVSLYQLSYFEPGAKFHYSNTGYSLLVKIIERISGLRYDEFIKANFLIPNGLNETSFPYQGTDQTIPSPFAPSYLYAEGASYDVTEDNMSAHVGEGNLITTPEDLAKWFNKLLTGNAGIEKKYIEFLMKDCQPTYESHQYYGLGCVYTPGLGYGHNGGHLAYWTVARYDPENDFTVVLFTNVWDWEMLSIDLYSQAFNMYDLIVDSKQNMGYK